MAKKELLFMNFITKSALTLMLSLPLGFASAPFEGHIKRPQLEDSKEVAQHVRVRASYGYPRGRFYRDGAVGWYGRDVRYGGYNGYYGYPGYGYYNGPYTYYDPYYYRYYSPVEDTDDSEYYYYGY